MPYIADLHLHSRYARGVSPSLDLGALAAGAKTKGLALLATGDFTHPQWREELRAKLEPGPGDLFTFDGVRFVLGTEVSCVYQQGGRTRRVHILLYAPSFETADRLCMALSRWGDLASDGRPTLGLSSRDLLSLALEADPRCVVVPAHAWTPWFSVYGSRGGFESIGEAFGDLLPHISAVETGLSSDPGMNWRVPELDGMAIVSYSDAHSVPRMGREVTAFNGEMTYEGYRRALRENDIAYTLEFYPEEGKYHLDGHRKCGVVQTPEVTAARGGRCPVCRHSLTLGVATRVERQAGRDVPFERDAEGFIRIPGNVRPPFKRLVPLQEVVAEALGRGVTSKGVVAAYQRTLRQLGPELQVLQHTALEEIARVAGERVAEGVGRVRRGEVIIEPGYDGVYGTVHIWPGTKGIREEQALAGA